MLRSFIGVSGRIATCAAAGLLAAAGSRAAGEDIYFHRTISELKITEGRLPTDEDPEPTPGSSSSLRLRPAIQPYAVTDGGGEVYIDRHMADRLGFVGRGGGDLDILEPGDVVAFRVPGRREIAGRLFAPKVGGRGMEVVSFKADPPPPQDDARDVFARAKRGHYGRLLARDLPGAEWFRQQAREAEALTPAGPADVRAEAPLEGRANDLERTFDLFSASRAVDENLQLDRPLTPPGAQSDLPTQAGRVKTEGLKGITVAAIDWAARIKGRTPTLDPLAKNIPADQHAVFLPDLRAAAAILAEVHGDSLPVLGLIETRSEDNGVQRRYERQLGVSLADLGRFAVEGEIKSLAITGSDPYLPSGTDLAVLIETGAPDKLRALLKARLDDARRADTRDAGGEIDGVRYDGARTPDRSLCAYVATLGRTVVVTNSPAQLARLVETAHGKTPALAGEPEYVFFRDRYPRGDADESALLVLTDATIRRWCGPRWRIGSSRRVRAAAALGEVQARNLPRIVIEETKGVTPQAPAGSIDLGRLELTRSGVRSETFGTLAFQTPIVELPLSEVDAQEAEAYARWRDTYQQNWRGVFDPIAVRFAARPDRLAADVSVMPLIVGTEYRPFLELVGTAKIAPGAGDPHPGSLAHAVMALDVGSRPLRQGGDLIANLTRVPQQVALGWIGGSAALYLDDDPFWKELAEAPRPGDYLEEHGDRLPLAAHVAVTSSAKLALFLTGLRAFIDQSAPNLTVWENGEHKGRRYVRVTEAEGALPNNGRPRFSLYYYASPRSLTLSLNEDVVRRSIDRQEEKVKAGDEGDPWPGKSLALRVSELGFEALGVSARDPYRDELRLRSWGNLPVLNEWKRLFPDRDPVALHEAAWGATLVDPGGGRYVWNARWATMESTALGHPGEPKPWHETNNPLGRIASAELGLSFEEGGLRATTTVRLKPKP